MTFIMIEKLNSIRNGLKPTLFNFYLHIFNSISTLFELKSDISLKCS